MTQSRRVRLTAEARRAQLIAEAEEMLSAGGYQSLSVAMLAERTGLTRAGVRHHIESKDALLIDLLTERDRRSVAQVREMLESDGIRAALDETVRTNISQPEVVRLYTILGVEALNVEHPAHEYFARRVETVRTRLAPYLGGFDRNGMDVAIEILSFLDGLQVNWLRDPSVDMWERWTSFADALFAQRVEG